MPYVLVYISSMTDIPIIRECAEVPSAIRESYLRDVSLIMPCDEAEAEDIAETLTWLKHAPALNKPENMDQHLGVFSVLLAPDLQSTFLINHRKAQLWLPPGGHVDTGLTFHKAAEAEIQEELGINQPVSVFDGPIFLTRTLTQGLNAGHIDVTAWLTFRSDAIQTYAVQEKEATHGQWIGINQLLSDPQYSSLHRGFRKMKSLLQN